MHPPKLPLKFLRWFCRSEQIDEVEGDLIELYELRYAKSVRSAQWRFAWDVLRSFRPTNVKKLKILNMSQGIFKHTIKTGFRQMSRNRLFSTLNIAGIALSFLAFFMISLFVYDELNYDRFHHNYDQLFRVLKTDSLRSHKAAITPPAIAPRLVADYPEIQKSTRVYKVRQLNIKYDDREVSMKGFFADSSFFELFTFPVLYGQRTNLLHDRMSVVLTASAANSYFEGEEAVGKIISFNDKDFVVSAVVQDPPANSHLQFEYVIPMKGIWPDKIFDNWRQSFVSTYVLADVQDEAFVNEKISRLLLDNAEGYVSTTLMLQPLSEIHLDPKVNFNMLPTGNAFYVKIFILAGIVILIIASINFMNLNLARATHRIKEVGVRKLIGAQRRTIIHQFIGETLLIVIISLILAAVVFVFSLPYFNAISGKSFTLGMLWSSMPWLNIAFVIVGMVALMSALSGMYPAIAISAIAPIQLIRGWVSARIGNMSVGRALTVLQFAVSIMLVICSMIAMSQLEFMRTKELGWDQNNLIQIPLRRGMFSEFELFKNELLKQDAIENVTWVSELPVDVGTGGSITFEGMNPEKHYSAYYMNGGMDFYNTFRMQSLDGYELPKIIDESKSNYVINESLLAMMQEEWGPDVSPIGKELDGGVIVGVVKNYHWQPMTKKIGPILYGLNANDSYGSPGVMVVRIKNHELKAGLDLVESTHEKVFPNRTLHFEFVDEKLAALYETETKTANLLGYFASFVIFISCLGLLGLAYHAVSSRIKSLSIRKVLGASMTGLFYQFTKEFGLVLLFASILSSPVAYFMMNKWLSSFAYRIDIDWQYFAAAIGGMVLLVLFIVGAQFYKVASVNPARTLRDE